MPARKHPFFCGLARVSYICENCGSHNETRAGSLNRSPLICPPCSSKHNAKGIGPAATKHGLYQTRLYRIWQKMKARCYNPNQDGYKYYGGKGITLCDEWREDAKAFYDWGMANGYGEELTIDRIDSNGHYEPSNCQWMTQAENSRKVCIEHWKPGGGLYNRKTRKCRK